MAVSLRNVSLFILVLLHLRRCSIALDFIAKDDDVTKITGPWREAILYVLNKSRNEQYDRLFSRQFFDLNAHERCILLAVLAVLSVLDVVAATLRSIIVGCVITGLCRIHASSCNVCRLQDAHRAVHRRAR